MEQQTSVWKANLTNGLILSLLGIVYSLIIWILDLTFNRVQGYIFMVILIVALFLLVKSYRDNHMYGRLTFGQAFGAGVIIFLYFSIITALFTWLMYTVIDPELSAKQLAFTEELMARRNMPQQTMDAAMEVQKKLMKPGIISLMGLFGNMFTGVIMSLLVAIFARKEGNPLIDTPVNQ